MNRTVSYITRCGECHELFVFNIEREQERIKSAVIAVRIGRGDLCERCVNAWTEKFKDWAPIARVNGP